MEDFHFRKNNFDLIRLAAAVQVVLVHGFEHFEIPKGAWFGIIELFPGVPIFFVISGFLVSASLTRSSSLASYTRNRLLRIYPGLWICFIASVATVFLTFNPSFSWQEFGVWVLAQTTVVQFYNPEFLREYGIGVLNGSLWTIPVELQFYLLLPLLYSIFNRIDWNHLVLFSLMVFLIGVNQFYHLLLFPEPTIWIKLLGVTALPYLYLFLFGLLLQKHFHLVMRYLSGKALTFLLIYTAITMTTNWLGLANRGNYINPISALVLGLLIVSLGYSYTDKFGAVLGRTDISYGTYIYHMVFVNALLQLDYFPKEINFVLMLVLTTIAALLSWRLIERPALSLKSYSVRNSIPSTVATQVQPIETE